ncbi:hypothetical protein F862_gp021 [Vibrio phage vB_VpaS_MAR10]|uniref:Uncharacterized protein n=1 Tax=Vibrio phage vB_VpaS_MAR10 TaxID=1229755 RepID=K7R9C3_9CAUD|nr:hypothetical protein F862_gp021 [Vibrio phage vB_VpaS_MAR10]AFV81253.1 hypothetical protein MAR10_021 [Vibrio phage vB_VpaS_MAR10]
MRNPTVKEVADEIESLTRGSGTTLRNSIMVAVNTMREGGPLTLFGYVVDKTGEATVFKCEVPVEEVVGVYPSTGEIIVRVDPPITGARLFPTMEVARVRASHRVVQRMEKLRKHSREVSGLTASKVPLLKLPQ